MSRDGSWPCEGAHYTQARPDVNSVMKKIFLRKKPPYEARVLCLNRADPLENLQASGVWMA